MSEHRKKKPQDALPESPFYAALARSLSWRGLRLEEVCRAGDALERRVLEEYGAMFMADASVRVPTRCIFSSEKEVSEFQRAATFRAEIFSEWTVELQPAAMESLVKAREEVRREGLDITPRDGSEAGRRGYSDTLRLWQTRFLPALDYWTAQGRLSTEQAARLRSLPPARQVAEVLELEKDGIFFSKDFSKTVLQSVAAPGTSPHLSMYAFDAVEFKDATLRRILARHGWFQTVASDLPHFTFLGLEEDELPAHGLRPVEVDGQLFWIPELREEVGG